jgi:hypothetical protein
MDVDMILSIIGGTSGAGVIVATLVGMIKSVWKPKNKVLYWIPASLLSVCSTIIILWYTGTLFFTVPMVLVIVLLSAYTAVYELVVQNEKWPQIKKILADIIRKLIAYGSKKV